MWVSWTVCGLTAFISSRYMGSLYEWRMLIHQVSGMTAIVGATMAVVSQFARNGWELVVTYHSVAGLITATQIPILAGLAFATYLLRYSTDEWNVKLVLTISDIHKYHGYTILGLSQITVTMGLAYYILQWGKVGLAIGLMVGNILLVGGLIALFEILY